MIALPSIRPAQAAAIALAATALTAFAAPAFAADGLPSLAPVSGVAAAAPTAPSIVQRAIGSPDHSTLVAAVQAAGLVETLAGPGPFTVFAPTNAAFAKLPAGTVENLLRPEQKATLTKVLTYHVVAGNVSSRDLRKMIRNGFGRAKLTTVAGEQLIARMVDGQIVLFDKQGGRATVTAADLTQSNGVIHVTDSVSLPG